MLASKDVPGVLHSFQLGVSTKAPQAVISIPPEVGPLNGVTPLNSKHRLSGAKSSTRHVQTREHAAKE